MRVPPVLGLFLGEWEEARQVHDIDEYVFAEGFLPH
jgi:hypothetical protein